ncbi:MAG: hypothetical protein BV459_08160 [Thermoplasmata archaeon M11B2D]|nr:MAG: hypothetical protein BV459_08160 [Thermoplasmata archaeon M11B2D]PNX53020.1 MAG: hypothetical protein BV458_06660 [Thermoplasmata archaeon M9B2D]
MDALSLYNSDLFKWIILPLLIFIARLIDVSLGTLRIIFVSHGLKYAAPLVGFLEINIWLLAIGQIMQNLDNLICSVAYAAGFAMGAFIGILLEEKLSIGMVMVRVICKHDVSELVKSLQDAQYGVTTHDAEGIKGPVKIIFAVIRREDLDDVIDRIHKIHPHAFYSVEDIRSVGEAMFPYHRHRLFQLHRKGK